MTVAAARPQAIAGVSPGQERVIEVVHPSVAAVGPGRLIGRVMECVPSRVFGLKLSNLIFGLPLAPLGVIGYLQLKVLGRRYIVTNRSVSIAKALHDAPLKQVLLKDIADVLIDVQPGQEFHYAGDLVLVNAKGEELLRLAGVCRPDRFRRVIMDARDARMYSDDSLTVISKRG